MKKQRLVCLLVIFVSTKLGYSYVEKFLPLGTFSESNPDGSSLKDL
jgi:hypothetical protein